jgi:hypothetical protein
MVRAYAALVDDPFAAIVDEAGVEEVRVDELGADVVVSEAAFTLLFTKRCSLPSKAMLAPLSCAETPLDSRVRALRAGAVVGLACETKV